MTRAVRDVVGTRAKLAVIMPQTNTVVEHDYALLAPAGVTFHYARAEFSGPEQSPDRGGPSTDSDEAFGAVIRSIHEGSWSAIDRVMTARPDHMIMGMSAETFWDGARGNEAFEREIHERCGLEVTTGASACRQALERYGVRRIGCVSPYPPIGERHVARFFTDHGFEVADSHGFACESPAAMAQVADVDLRPIIDRFISVGVDAIVQAGTNLSMVGLAAAVERHVDIPIIPINAACVWHALRAQGIDDRFSGRGRLFEEL